MEPFDQSSEYPPLVISERSERERELQYFNAREWCRPLETLSFELEASGVALITAKFADPIRAPKKFLYSSAGDRQIITATMGYIFNGPVRVETWKPSLRWLLSTIDFEHINSSLPLQQRHFERIEGKEIEDNETVPLAQRAYFDMLWNVNKYA